MACPSGSLNGFPVTTTVPITDILLASISENFEITASWGIRYTIPNFIGSTADLDEVIGSTNIEYNSNKYTLLSVQFEKASHVSWLSTANQPNNQEDLVFTFNYNSLSSPIDTAPQLIIIVVPIIRNVSNAITSDPVYLQALGDPTKNGQALTLQSVIPETTYVYYNTCLNMQLKSNLALNQNMNFLVFVNTAGLSVSTGTMTRIGQYYNRISASGAVTTPAGTNATAITPYPPYTIPFLTLNSGITPYTISSQLDFGLKIRSTAGIFNAVVPLAPPTNETTDAYKCVPLDPETQVQNGQLMVDPNTGALLTTVLGDRQKEITATVAAPGTPGTVSFAFSSSIATIVGVTLVFIFIVIILTLTFGQFGMYVTTTVVRTSSMKFILFGIVIFLIAFFLGQITATASALFTSASTAASTAASNALKRAKGAANSAISNVTTAATTAATNAANSAGDAISDGMNAAIETRAAAIGAAQKAMASAIAAANPELATGKPQIDAAKVAEADAVASTVAAQAAVTATSPSITAIVGGAISAASTAAAKGLENAKKAEKAAIDARVAVDLASTQCTATSETSAACVSAKTEATTRLTASAEAANTSLESAVEAADVV